MALSDQYLVYTCIDLKVKSREHKTIRYKDFKDFNVDNFIADLDMSNIHSKATFNYNNTIDMWNTWKDEYLNICNRHAPFKQIKVKHRYNNPWITSDIIILMYKQDYMGNKAIINNNPVMMNEYSKL